MNHGRVSRQVLLTYAKKEATDLMFLAEKADEEATREADRLQRMQKTAPFSSDTMFDSRVRQRQVWMAKSEMALRVSTASTLLDAWRHTLPFIERVIFNYFQHTPSSSELEGVHGSRVGLKCWAASGS